MAIQLNTYFMAENFSFQNILSKELAHRCAKNPSYSLRAFAKAIGVSPASLSLILNGKRVPSARLCSSLVDRLQFNPKDQQEFLASVGRAHSQRKLKRQSPFFKALAKETATTRAAKKTDFLEHELFKTISDWQHYAIMMLLETEGATANPRWIAKQLGITPIEASLSFKRMVNLGLLKKKKNSWTIDSSYLTTADKNKTSPALRKHQRQMLEKALFSLENDPIENRSITSLTMAVDPSRIEPARKMIEDFSRELCDFLEGGNRTQVYQLGVNLFPLQKRGMNENSNR